MDFDYSLDNGAPGYLQVAFAVSISLSIALNLYVAVCCTMLQQNGKVARSLAISSGTAGDFDAVIKGWYQEEGFARFRTRLVWMFTLSFLFFGGGGGGGGFAAGFSAALLPRCWLVFFG